MNQYCPECGDDRYNSGNRCMTCDFPHTMTRDEKRMIRREYINYFLHLGMISAYLIAYRVKLAERRTHGYELKVY